MPPHPQISDLTAHRGYWLRMVSNAVSHRFARRIEAEGVTVAEWAVLRLLYDVEGMPPSVLAETMAMTRGAISKLADRLEAKGFVRRIDNPQDRRGHSLALTEAGRRKTPILAALADENDAACFSVLTDEEGLALDRLLRALVERRGLTAPPVD